MQPTEMHLSQKEKYFSEYSNQFFKSTLNFEHFQKRMSPLASAFPKLQTPKRMVR